jgi:hypothetical protein
LTINDIISIDRNYESATELNMSSVKYKANFMTVPLSLPESRIIAGLLLDNVTEEGWNDAVITKNVLQRRTQSTAATQAGMIRNRLNTMGPELWMMVRDGAAPVATQAVFAAILKFSPLLADFLDLVVREQYRRFQDRLRSAQWDTFMEGCPERDLTMPDWSEATRNKLKQAAFKILAEVGYLSDTRTLCLQPVRIAPELMNYLKNHNEDYTLRCIDVSHG